MIRKTNTEVLNSLLKALEEKMGINDADPGSIARTFSEIIAEEIGAFYRSLDTSITMSFLSSARDQFVDLIGALLGCTRLPGESDSNYKARITNQVYVIQGGNYTSLRLRVLQVEGVKDLIAAEFTRGAGSFTFYIITDEPETPRKILNEVEAVVAQAKALGIFAEVKSPLLLPLDMKIRLIFNDKVTDVEKESIRQSARQLAKAYIDNLGVGGNFVLNQVIDSIMGISTKIVDLDVSSFKIKDRSQYIRNIQANWNERIVIQSLEVS